MKIKTDLITTVNSFLTVLVKIQKIKDSLLEIVYNFYGEIITEDNTTTGNVFCTKNPIAGYLYNVKVCKQGRKVTLSGQIFNQTGGIVGINSSNYFFEITGAEFLPDPDSQYYAQTTTLLNNGATSIVRLGANRLYTNSIPNNTAVSFNFQYLTKD